MAKKKKKIVPPEVKFKRRVKKYLKRLLFMALLVLTYFKLLPVLFPAYAPQVANTKYRISQVGKLASLNLNKILGSAIELSQNISSGSHNVETLDAEALVDNAVADLTERIKELPKEQVKKVKRNFCADVINETLTASTSAISDN